MGTLLRLRWISLGKWAFLKAKHPFSYTKFLSASFYWYSSTIRFIFLLPNYVFQFISSGETGHRQWFFFRLSSSTSTEVVNAFPVHFSGWVSYLFFGFFYCSYFLLFFVLTVSHFKIYILQFLIIIGINICLNLLGGIIWNFVWCSTFRNARLIISIMLIKKLIMTYRWSY